MGGPVLLVLMLSVVLAGPSKREKKSRNARAEVAGPLQPAGAGVDPRFVPALLGRAERLELEGLKRTTIRFTVEQDGTVLQQITAEQAEVLRRQLGADPRWRVSRLRDTWVATLRDEVAGQWTSGPEGYHLAPDRCWRIGVRLGDPAPGYPWAESDAVQWLPATERVSLNWAIVLDDPPCRSQRAVAMVVDAPALGIEVLDSGDGEDLPRVVEALEDVPLLLANASIDTHLIEARGFDPDQLPGPPSERARAPSLRQIDGDLDLRAALHFDTPGLTWVRLIVDGKPWEEAAVADATLESPGWSDEPADHFPLQSRIPVDGPMPPITGLELWFQPDGGEPREAWSGPISIGS